MENNRFKSDEQSFLRLSQQREQNQRLKALFDNAVGEEEISLRDENVKHFNLGANRHQAVVYSEPVHFRNSESDAWQEIDNTLEETVTAQGRQVLRQPCQPHAGGIPAANGWRQHGVHHRKRPHVRVAL